MLNPIDVWIRNEMAKHIRIIFRTEQSPRMITSEKPRWTSYQQKHHQQGQQGPTFRPGAWSTTARTFRRTAMAWTPRLGWTSVSTAAELQLREWERGSKHHMKNRSFNHRYRGFYWILLDLWNIGEWEWEWEWGLLGRVLILIIWIILPFPTFSTSRAMLLDDKK